jgi:hypothetical protein
MTRSIAVAALLLTLAVAAPAAAQQARQTTGTVWAGANHSEGSVLFVSGDFRDRVLGRGAIVYQTTVRPDTAPGSVRITARRITLFSEQGTLTGTGAATQTTAPDGTATISDGTFSLTRGTGSLRGRRMRGTLTGTFRDGVFTFQYRATLTAARR